MPSPAEIDADRDDFLAWIGELLREKGCQTKPDGRVINALWVINPSGYQYHLTVHSIAIPTTP